MPKHPNPPKSKGKASKKPAPQTGQKQDDKKPKKGMMDHFFKNVSKSPKGNENASGSEKRLQGLSKVLKRKMPAQPLPLEQFQDDEKVLVAQSLPLEQLPDDEKVLYKALENFQYPAEVIKLIPNSNFWTPLQKAISYSDLDILQFLIDHGAILIR